MDPLATFPSFNRLLNKFMEDSSINHGNLMESPYSQAEYFGIQKLKTNEKRKAILPLNFRGICHT